MLVLHLSIVLLLIIVNSVFAMAEIALVSARKAPVHSFPPARGRGAEGGRGEGKGKTWGVTPGGGGARRRDLQG